MKLRCLFGFHKWIELGTWHVFNNKNTWKEIHKIICELCFMVK